MPRGLPDDSNIVKEGPTWTLTDQAELAARLGSIVTFDRLGTVLDLETFAKGRSRWMESLWGVASGVYLSNDRSLVDGVSLRLVSGTGLTPACQAMWYLAYPQLSRLGYEASYAVGVQRYRLYHGFNVFKGIYYANFSLRWTLTTGVLEYRDITAVWLDTGINIAAYPNNYMFNRIKLVGNALTEEYERLIINDNGYDMKGRYAERVGAVADQHVEAWSNSWGDGVFSQNTFLDACIFTESEPGIG